MSVWTKRSHQSHVYALGKLSWLSWRLILPAPSTICPLMRHFVEGIAGPDDETQCYQGS